MPRRRGISGKFISGVFWLVFILAMILAVNLLREKPQSVNNGTHVNTPSPSAQFISDNKAFVPIVQDTPRPTVTQGPDLIATAMVLQMQATNNAAAVQTEQAQAANQSTGTAAAYTATKNAVELQKDGVTITVMVANITATEQAQADNRTQEAAFFIADLEAHREKLRRQNAIDLAFRGGLLGIMFLFALVLVSMLLANMVLGWKPKKRSAADVLDEIEPDTSESDYEKIIKHWNDGKSQRYIEQAVYGYTGGDAYAAVKAVVDAHRFPYPAASNVENTVLHSSSSGR